MATITPRNAIAITLAATLLGAGSAWFAARTTADRDLRGLSLAHELEVMSLCAGGLSLHRAQRGETLVVLLEQRLDAAVGHATSLVDDGAALDPHSPNLKTSARRAADYYAAKRDDEKQRFSETLHARLQRGR